MNTNTLVFPIRCPGCPITLWGTGIQDDVAERVLDGDSMSVWVGPPFKRIPFQFPDVIFVASQKTTRFAPQTILPKPEMFGIGPNR